MLPQRIRKEAESKAEPQESQSVSQADKKMVDTVAVPQNMQAVANRIPVYYQIPVVDGSGNVVQRLPIERSVRKSSNSRSGKPFARLSFKKKVKSRHCKAGCIRETLFRRSLCRLRVQ